MFCDYGLDVGSNGKGLIRSDGGMAVWVRPPKELKVWGVGGFGYVLNF